MNPTGLHAPEHRQRKHGVSVMHTGAMHIARL
jgi:hypothetical protein